MEQDITTTTTTMQGILDKIKGATYTVLPDGRTTVCQLTLQNGFTVSGSSACVSIKNYNQALGEKYSYERAVQEIWQFEGYLLAERLHRAGDTVTEISKLTTALREDLDYAWSWHCNIAMAAFDAGCEHDKANEGAARFLYALAGVNTRLHPGFAQTQTHPMPHVAAEKEENHDI